jgi:hypothetical protein
MRFHEAIFDQTGSSELVNLRSIQAHFCLIWIYVSVFLIELNRSNWHCRDRRRLSSVFITILKLLSLIIPTCPTVRIWQLTILHGFVMLSIYGGSIKEWLRECLLQYCMPFFEQLTIDYCIENLFVQRTQRSGCGYSSNFSAIIHCHCINNWETSTLHIERGKCKIGNKKRNDGTDLGRFLMTKNASLRYFFGFCNKK